MQGEDCTMQTTRLSNFAMACKKPVLRSFSIALGLIVAAGPAAALESAYYESFVRSEIAAMSLTVPGTQLGIHLGNATNIALGGGKVYFQDGVDIYSAN